MLLNKKFLIKLSVILAFLFLLSKIQIVSADSRPDWAAEQYSKISEINLKPGETTKIKVGFYNRGAYNWRNTGKNYVSLYTYNPKYHASKLAAESWMSSSHIVKLKDSLAGPNSKGYFEFEIKAPSKTGTYTETFALAAENKAWVQNGQFTITVKVSNSAEVDEKGNIEAETEENAFLNPPKIEMKKVDYAAMKLSLVKPLKLNFGEDQTISLLFLNQGKQDWASRSIVLNNVSLAGVNTNASFANYFWLETNKVIETSDSLVKKGQTEIYTIPLTAPEQAGIFTLHFSLLVDGQKIEGGNFDLPVTVIDPNPITETAATTLIDDPRVRIGLFTTEEPMEFISTFDYSLQNNKNLELTKIVPGTKVYLSYNETNKQYVASWGEQKIISENPLRLAPLDTNAYFTLSNHELLARWGNNVNYNEFRDTLEIRWAEKTGYTWLINELDMENYLKGMAEESDSSPKEFLKAMAVAERSYAYYYLKNPGKHIAGGFDLDADYDQVYRGYVREKISPNAVAAVDETWGTVVTYNGLPVDTPYFARSNGKTKSAKIVWGADKPWLQAVVTPYDKGMTQWGHGVGISARDALYRAKNGANWDDILKYYYTGIELQRMY